MTAGTEASTRWPTIPKNVRALTVPPNLVDYDETCATFTWDEARHALSGLPGNRGLNIAYEAVDRHAAGARAAHEALRFVRGDGTTHSLSYAELAEQTGRCASVLRGLGIGRGDRVFSLLGRVPALYVAVLGTFKNASVFCPLFSAFGPEPVRQRLQLGGGRALVTTRALYRKKVAPIRVQLPDLRHVLLVDADGHPDPGTLDLAALLREAPPYGEIAATQGEDMALLHFTSGITGTPKGAIHVHDAVTAHDADTLPLEVLMKQLRDLVSRARGDRLQRAEMADPTLTVTNLGDLGVESVFGAIYPPQVALVGFGRVREEPWARNGLLGARPAITATLAADHRVSDGLRGGRFLARIDELLQNPEEL
ncbi:AMP-binding protein [Cryobacterium sp. M25]|uniref:AMP-binding protein n=1 Tax=Cryobacterium sp. M25 TaxID=2048293 RepID=UPI000CE2D06C|nr:AMP-binding protein [Cryobacterium sp. M25]